MRDSKITATLAAAVTLGAFANIYVTVSGGLFGPPVDRAIHEAGGVMMAKQALALLQPGGEITVITRDTRAFKNPATDIQMASFRRTLRAGHAKVHAVLALQVDPLRPVRVPAGDFCQIVRDTPAGSVVVSFMGPPLLSEAQWIQLGNIKPAIIAFCPGRMAEEVDLRPFLRAGVLKAAVVERSGLSGARITPGDWSGRSQRTFVTVTSANLDQLPSSTAP